MKTGVWVLVLALAPSLALARDMDTYGFKMGDWEITLNGSPTLDENRDDAQLSAEGSLARILTGELDPGPRQGIGLFDRNDDDDSNGSARLYSDYTFNLERLRPFMGINLGYLYGNDVDDTWIAGSEGGVKFFLVPDAFLFAILEYDFLFDGVNDSSDTYADSRIVYGLGLSIRY